MSRVQIWARAVTIITEGYRCKSDFLSAPNMQFNCVKNCTKSWTQCSLAQHRFPTRFVSLSVCSVYLLVRVTMVDKNKAVVCCLLATSAIMFSEKKKRKRKMWSKKWYLKRNISCDVHLLNELLESDVPWYDATVVSAGKLKKLRDSVSELHSFLCERRPKRTVLRPALLPVKTAQFAQFLRQVWRHTVKSLSLTGSVQGALRIKAVLISQMMSQPLPCTSFLSIIHQ